MTPPRGYRSWLHYAVATMETRDLFLEHCSGDENLWPENVQREDFREAALAELDALAGTPNPPTSPGRYRLTVDVTVWRNGDGRLGWVGAPSRSVDATVGLWSGPIEEP